MIAIETEQGEIVKVLKNVTQGEFGFHEKFGLISKKGAERRVETQKRQGHDFVRNNWDCLFDLREEEGTLIVNEIANCDILKGDSGWLITTPKGKFNLSLKNEKAKLVLNNGPLLESDNLLKVILLALIFLLIPLLWYLNLKPEDKDVLETKEPLTVKIIKNVKTVNVQRKKNPKIKTKPLTKAEVSKRAVKRNLGFLRMVGSKNISDAVGGVPQKLKKATAGAGPGGSAGSGGEVLTNFGKGLKKTTVGNTGVTGLGGKLVTKGTTGGGKGGYGNTLIASGTGSGISSIAVSSTDLVLEGGISRYAINATIAKYLNQVRRCYEAELKSRPHLQGLVEMGFEINKQGRLNFAKVNRTTLNDVKTETCISNKMMTWQFPKPKGGVKVPVKYPFMLRPVGN